jgi:hypothetical protein
MNLTKTINDETVNADFYSEVIDMSLAHKISIHAIFASALTGTWKLQASSENTSNPASWGDVPGSDQNVMGAGSVLWNNPTCTYKYLRVFFDYTAGSSNAKIHVIIKD